MERKHKIWLAVLLVLLIAAIAGVVYLTANGRRATPSWPAPTPCSKKSAASI